MGLRIFLFYFIFIGLKANAFTLNNSSGASFIEDSIRISVARTTSYSCSEIGLTENEILDLAVEAANKFWNTVPSSRLQLQRGSVVEKSDDFYTGSICTSNTSNCTPNETLKVSSGIIIACNNNSSNFSNSPSVVGVTVPNNITSEGIQGSLILINDTSANEFSNLNHFEKVAVIAHEIGHAIGLGHSPSNSALMYYTGVSNRNALAWDDIDGITWLYPQAQPDLGCGSVKFIENSSSSTKDSNNSPLSVTFFLLFVLAIKFLSDRFRRT